MSDFERYGDYNEVDESPKKSVVGLVLKIFITALCLGVVAFLVFRVFTFNYYPESAKSIYFTEELKELYNKNDGDIGALTQKLLDSSSFGFDDSTEGNFYCKHFIYIPETEELQITLRYNASLMNTIKEKYGIELDPDGESNFDFSLVAARSSDNTSDEDPDRELGTAMGETLVAEEYDSALMYRYVKLVFNDVKLDLGNENEVNWIRLEVGINGVEMKEPYMVLIYWNTEDFPLIPYELSAKEIP